MVDEPHALGPGVTQAAGTLALWTLVQPLRSFLSHLASLALIPDPRLHYEMVLGDPTVRPPPPGSWAGARS